MNQVETMSISAKTQGANSVERTAKHYAKELDAQFRTLNNFVRQAGEVGRAHEYYLRGVLSRFLPESIRLGSGFIASPNWISRQQDILIYQRDLTILFQVGDCLVVDYNAMVGTIEVKTNLDSSNECIKSLRLIAELEGRYRNRGLRALYAWRGIDVKTVLSGIYQFVEEAPDQNHCRLPHVIYVRGKYLLVANNEEISWTQPAFSLWKVGKGGITEGQALLGLVNSVWTFGLSKLSPPMHPPWWLLSWHDFHGHLPDKGEPVLWPPHLSAPVAKR
jgi:hypothetical protein